MARNSNPLESNKQKRFEALKLDTKVGMTFATLASEAAEGSEKRTRNQNNARAAYQTVLRLSKKLKLTSEQRQDLAGRLSTLKSALEALGESVL
jgi:hypothetical protein